MGERRTSQTAPGPRARASPGTEALQRRMKVGAAGDRFEREADRIADHVVGPSALPAAAPPPVISPLSVQRTVMDEERETGPEEPAQLKAGPEKPAREDELSKALNAQRDARGPGAKGGTAPSGVESSIRAMRSGPAPGLGSPLRSRMENKMGVDLGGVRVHSGASAGSAAETLNARAFTVGQDMFFGRGQYDPVSTAGQRLISHEAAHTVQQRGGSAGVQRIQRANDANADAETEVELVEDKTQAKAWAVDKTQPTPKLTLPALELPRVAGGLKGTTVADGPQPMADGTRQIPSEGQAFTLASTTKRDTPTGASVVWTREARSAYSGEIKKTLTRKRAASKNVDPFEINGKKDVYFLYSGARKAESANVILTGTVEELSMHDSVLRPMISRTGGKAKYDVDHILELQLGGKDSFDNMWLLEWGYNRSVGSSLKGYLNKTIDTHLDKAEKQLAADKQKLKGGLTKDHDKVKRGWTIHFKEVIKGKKYAKETKKYWTPQQIGNRDHLKFFKFMTNKEVAAQGLVFKDDVVPKRINLFPTETGGWVIPFEVKDGGKKLKKPYRFFSGMNVTGDAALTLPTKTRQGQELAKLPVKYGRKNKDTNVVEWAEKEISVIHHPNLGFGGYVSRHSITQAFKDMKFKSLSPINFPDVQITPDGKLFAQGQILSSKALLPGLQIPITLLGDEIFLEFPIPTDRLKFGPVKVTEAALIMGVGKNGFFIAGQAGVAIDKLGSGTLLAKATRKDTIIGGSFVFDFNFVENAEVDAEYSLAKDDFKAKGTLTVKKGTLPGVESGTIEIDATRQTFGVTGTLQLGGVLAGSTITVGYTPETGLLIEGKDIPLPVDGLPGVSDARVTVRAQRSPDTGEWLLSGAGSATLKAPGAGGSLTIAVKGEQVHFDGRIDLAKGPAKGFIQVTATNLQMDENGKPVEDGSVGPLQIWGKGQATIAFGEVLTGTAGIEYTREGRIIITGEIALPPTVDLFKRVDYSKRLLEIAPPDFPIWGIKLGPVGIGIFAFVDARLDFLAYVGPGQLRDAKINATVDLDKPSEATVEGQAQFYVPAFAGFKLDLGGGLKAQIAVAYVKGRVGLDGTLGLGVEGKIDVGVNWNATDGLAFDANANVTASPKFELGVNASVTAGVSLPWPLSDISKTWGPWRKKLGEFGPNMELSADFPIAWSEKKGLDFDIDKIKVTKPRLDAKELMKSAFDTLV